MVKDMSAKEILNLWEDFEERGEFVEPIPAPSFIANSYKESDIKVKIEKAVKAERERCMAGRMSIVKAILELPATVEYQGVVFEFQLFISHSDELRFCYLMSYVLESSRHYKDYSDKDGNLYEKWVNPSGDVCDWLYLVENISDDEVLLKDIDGCKAYLRSIGCANA